MSRRIYYSVTILLLLVIFGMLGIDYVDERDLTYAADQPTVAPKGKISIVIKVPQRLLEVYNDGQLYKRYRVAVGKKGTPSPVGEWYIVNKDYSDKEIFGTRWLGLNVPWGSYGIHGTNRPWSIGQWASQGCIRLRNQDIEELFEWVSVGTPVKIEGPKVKIQRVLKYTCSGQDVVCLQQRLKQLGYLREAGTDGLFGRDTEEAVKIFQHDKGLEITGVVDKKTLDMLGL